MDHIIIKSPEKGDMWPEHLEPHRVIDWAGAKHLVCLKFQREFVTLVLPSTVFPNM